MTLTLRRRIVLTLTPLVVLLALLGLSGFLLLSRLSGRIDVILRDNYDSVRYMERLNESLERIDSSYQLALAGREEDAKRQYDAHWKLFELHLENERRNVTLPGEQELVDQMAAKAHRYRQQGDEFFKHPEKRHQLYFGDDTQGESLYRSFNEIKDISGKILHINQDNMEAANNDARATAASSVVWFGVGIAVCATLALLWALHTVRTLLQPLQNVTSSVKQIGAGNLDQLVAVQSGDEIGELAGAVNTMARQLRHYRQSQQARLLRLQQASQATIDAIPHPVVVVDPEGRLELNNPAARLLFPGQLAPAGEVWTPPPTLRGPLDQALHQQLPYLPEGFEQVLVLRLGDEEHVYLPRIFPIRDTESGTLGAAVLLEDVTKFRLLDEVKSNLVATVSHELKTPLTSLRLALHLLAEETIGPLTPKQLELVLDARDNSERLLAMINHLLDMARLRDGRDRTRRAVQPIRSILDAAADMVRPHAEAKGVDLKVEAEADLPLVEVDVAQMQHALRNLLDNALHYTEVGGSIALAARPGGRGVSVSVSDTGSGIAPEHLAHIFDRFYRVPGQSVESGTGLGLSIVRDIVTAHGGAVSCDSIEGAGTTFRLDLPVMSAEEGRA